MYEIRCAQESNYIVLHAQFFELRPLPSSSGFVLCKWT